MCGRFTQKSSPKKVAERFEVEGVPPLFERYNVAPTQKVLGIRESADGREATFFKWGLVPSWAKDPAVGNKLINARSETVTEKPSFREALKSRRILVPAEGFYEWARRGDQNSSRAGDSQPISARAMPTAPSATEASSSRTISVMIAAEVMTMASCIAAALNSSA